MYGFALDDYWLFTLPVKNFKANTTLNLRALISSSAITRTSATGHEFWPMEYKPAGRPSTPRAARTNDHRNRAAHDRLHAHECPTRRPTARIVDDDITIPTAIADGNIYLRLRVCDATGRQQGQGSIDQAANGGTIRMKTKEGICDAISVTEVHTLNRPKRLRPPAGRPQPFDKKTRIKKNQQYEA
ncbi:MAG: hypothetical protein V8Q45_03005 [Alistipes onderdonkii]